MNQFCFVGICAGLAMLMLMIMPSSIADDKLKIYVKGDKNAIVYVKKTDTVLKVKEKIVEQLKKNTKEENNIFMKKNLKEIKHKGKYEIIHKQNAKLEENNEIVPARITLRLNENGSPLEDGKTMKECGIVKDTVPKTIYLTWDELEIKVKGDKNATVYINETDKVLKVKEKIVKQLKKIIETELSKANAKETEIITVIKEKLFGKNKRIDELMEEKNKILTTRKILRLDKNGSPFEDGKTISEYVKNGAIVFLELEGYEILVDYKGKTYTIWVNKEDTVYELKEKIKKVIDIDETKRIWTFPSHDDVFKDYTKTMLFYNIGKGTLLSLKRQFIIGCHYNGKEYFPIVEETEKLSSVKEKVLKEIQEKSGIQLKNIRLSYRGEGLKDDREIGSYYGIDSKSTIVGVSELEQTSDD